LIMTNNILRGTTKWYLIAFVLTPIVLYLVIVKLFNGSVFLVLGATGIIALHQIPFFLANIKFQTKYGKNLTHVLFSQKDPGGKTDFIVLKNYFKQYSFGLLISIGAGGGAVAISENSVVGALIWYSIAIGASLALYDHFINLKIEKGN